MLCLMTPMMKLQLNYFNSLLYKMYVSIEVNTMLLMFILSLIMIFKKIMIFKILYLMNSKMMLYFNILMFLFFFSMMGLILSSSLLPLLVSWEGLGTSSYLLVLYYMNWNSIQGSYLTMITNRFGDSFLMAFMMIFYLKLNFAFLLIIIFMSITKSAQVPFMSWLPAAMAAPTPVSALVHSSTLVTAGILLMVKFYMPIFLLSVKEYLTLFGIITMMSGSISALYSNDMKKIVAFSTLSQLGFMMMIFYSLWMGLSLYHLLIHAFLKSFLFILVGVMILKIYSQSIFSMGSYTYKFSLISMFLLIFLSFCNMLFSMMFFSKETSNLFMSMNMLFYKIFYLMILIITLMYTLRLYMMLNNVINNISVITKFHKTNLNLNFFLVFNILGILWYINLIKFKFSLVLWNLVMTLMLLMTLLKMKIMNLFSFFLLINSGLNKLILLIYNLFKEELCQLSWIYNFYFIKVSVINWVWLLSSSLLFILM